MRDKRKMPWGVSLLLWCLMLLALGALGCTVLYQYTGVYERTRPEIAMDAIMENTTKDQWHDAIKATTAAELSEFEDAGTIFDEYFDAVLRDAEFTYTRNLSYTDPDSPGYTVYSGVRRICTVILRPIAGSSQGFGRHLWELDSVLGSDFTKNLDALTVQIDAPKDYTLRINGVSVSDSYITADDIACPHESELESRFTRKDTYLRYTVPGLYGDVVVTDDEGNEISPSGDVENGMCPYVVDSYGEYSFTIKAPDDATVTVCGAVLGEDDVSHPAKNIFEGIESYAGGREYGSSVYSFDGLYTLPDIHVTDSEGRELSAIAGEDGQLDFFHGSNEDVPDYAKNAAQNFFERYMAYTSHGYNGASLNNLLAAILPGTELHSYTKNSEDAMYWASETNLSYDELTIDHFDFLNENCFTCTIRYKADATAQAWYEQYSYELEDGYQLVFVNNYGTWLAAAMVSLNG